MTAADSVGVAAPGGLPSSQERSSGSLRINVYLTCEADQSLGSAYVALGFARGLAGRGHAVTIREPRDYEPLRAWGHATFYRQSIGLTRQAMRDVRNECPDVVLFYGGEAWLAIERLSRIRRRRPLIVVHSNGLEPHMASLMSRAEKLGRVGRRRWFQLDLSGLTERGFRRVDGLVLVSHFDGAYAAKREFPRSARRLVVENPIPKVYLAPVGTFHREKVIGFCGGWIERKGIDRIREEIPVFLRRNPDWKFRILGVEDTRLLGTFAADVRDRIELVSREHREGELLREYDRLAILLAPSIYESFGLVVAEAMARACAVVATPVGFAASLEDGEEISLCNGDEPGSLAEALERLARSPETRARLARKGRARVESLRWSSAIDALESTLIRWRREVGLA